MTCSIATIAAVLGFTPQPGTLVNVPASYVDRLTYSERYQVKSCARKHGIRWRIVDGR